MGLLSRLMAEALPGPLRQHDHWSDRQIRIPVGALPGADRMSLPSPRYRPYCGENLSTAHPTLLPK